MQSMDPVHTLTRIRELTTDRELDEARNLARELWRELQRDRADPMQRGWARFYEVKCSHGLGDHRAVYELLSRPPGATYVLSSKNAAWMYSVAAEAAMHLRLPAEVVRFAKQCLELRTEVIPRAQCAQTACALLAQLERQDLAIPFARELLELWKRAPAESLLTSGARYLLAAGSALEPEDRQRLRELTPQLAEVKDERFADLARELVERIRRVS